MTSSVSRRGSSGDSFLIVAQQSVPLSAIVIGKTNPRQTFAEDDLAELVRSIGEFGVLQPVVVTPLKEDEQRYELIAGERRVRASLLAGLDSIPALIAIGDRASLRTVQLDENRLRVQLNPIEEAQGFANYRRDFPCSLAKLARHLRYNPDYVRGRLKLLELPPLVQEAVSTGALALGSAWELLAVATDQERSVLATIVMQDHLSVSQTAELVHKHRVERQQMTRREKQAVACERYARELRQQSPLVLTMAEYRPEIHRRSPLLVFDACATCQRKGKLVLAPGKVDAVCVDHACFARQAHRNYEDRSQRLEELYRARSAALATVLQHEYVQHEHLQLQMWTTLSAMGPLLECWRAERGLPPYAGGCYGDWDILSAWSYEQLLTELVGLSVGYIARLTNNVLPDGLKRCLIAAFGIAPALLGAPDLGPVQRVERAVLPAPPPPPERKGRTRVQEGEGDEPLVSSELVQGLLF